ncbi:MAG: 30S ribosome-binding factor RbfA [Nitrosomonadales bacterium]|jgi:ribosome-binding factor A|nr:MAG: 30S ribosome-binding factor RbfA [Nitrosomonadales bacterium]
MAKDFSRSKRVAEQMQRELADLLQFELKDPRVGMATITEVEVSNDLSHAKIYFVVHENAEETLAGLQKAAGFLRSQLSQRLLLRSVPQLHFVYDSAIERGVRISQLIDEAVASDDKSHQS